jgi:tetratricopeptide (TPR) repeat protein
MTDRNLPAPKQNISDGPASLANRTRSVVALALFTVVLGMFLTIGLQSVLSGHVFGAVFALTFFCIALWSAGSLYLTLPLSIYFLDKYYNHRDYAKIDRAHSTVLKILNGLPLRKRVDIAITMSNLALARLCQGYTESAETLFEQALAYLTKAPRLKQSLCGVVVYHNLAVVSIRLRKYVEAEMYASDALEIARSKKIAGKYKCFAGPPTASLAAVRYKLGEYDSCYEMFKEALDLYSMLPLPPGLPKQSFDQGRAFCWLGLALVTIKLGKTDESSEWCQKVFQAVELNPGMLSTLGLEPLNELANEYMNLKMFDRAEKLMNIAYAIGHNHPFHPDAKQVLNYFEKLLLLTGRQEEVADMRAWLRGAAHTPLLTADRP